jgi:hypothetical protein
MTSLANKQLFDALASKPLGEAAGHGGMARQPVEAPPPSHGKGGVQRATGADEEHTGALFRPGAAGAHDGAGAWLGKGLARFADLGYEVCREEFWHRRGVFFHPHRTSIVILGWQVPRLSRLAAPMSCR